MTGGDDPGVMSAGVTGGGVQALPEGASTGVTGGGER